MVIINFTIPLDPRTKKNSQRMVKRGNRYIPLPSEAFEQYQKDAGLFIRGRGMNLQTPLEIRCEFYMRTRRRVDLVNLLEAIDDILVHYGVIADDNSNIVVSHDGSRVHWEKDYPRTEITILSMEERTMLNHITIMGRLTRDPELRRTGSGVAVTSFTLAVDRDFGENKETDFIDCVAWRQTGEFVSKYFTKGRMAVVSGRLQIRGWEDKDGNKRRTAEIVVDNCYFGDSKRDSDQGGYTVAKEATPDYAVLDEPDAQLPF